MSDAVTADPDQFEFARRCPIIQSLDPSIDLGDFQADDEDLSRGIETIPAG